MIVPGEGLYRRHSALRTIRGGICWGFILRVGDCAQLLLLGYQRLLKICGFMGMLRFLFRPNIVAPVSLYKNALITLLPSDITRGDFRCEAHGSMSPGDIAHGLDIRDASPVAGTNKYKAQMFKRLDWASVRGKLVDCK